LRNSRNAEGKEEETQRDIGKGTKRQRVENRDLVATAKAEKGKIFI